MLTKNTFINILVWLWIVLSISYISYDLFSKYTINIMQRSYVSGQTDTINSLIAESTKGCDWFNVFSWEKKVMLINVECLKTKGEENRNNETKK